MKLFAVIAGTAAIGSLLISGITLFKIIRLEKRTFPPDSDGLRQDISAKTIADSDLRQAGRDVTE